MDNSNEKRSDPRKKTLKGATIAYRNGHCTMTCTIRDLSETGALLKPADAVHVPDTFKLILFDGVAHDCEVSQRTRDQLAVRFA